jgi:hypothetical protein
LTDCVCTPITFIFSLVKTSEMSCSKPCLSMAFTATSTGYTALPADLPDVVAATTRQVTDGATSTYDAALSLQAWFQNEFDYSLDVRPGHDTSAIETFLEDRVGYCEQFAGTYAAMLRTLEIPTRVAVGFTSGVPLGNGEHSVLGRNAHAWPEVWFDDIGWVDAFRVVNQEADQYTWWSNRGQAWARNVGWRIDYQIVSPGLRDTVLGARIHKDERFSDHAPLIVEYAIDLP